MDLRSRVVVVAMLVIVAMAWAINRPGVPAVPWGFDPNQVVGEVILFRDVQVGVQVSQPFGVWCPRDGVVDRSCSIGVVQYVSRTVDPNSGEKWAYFTVDYTPMSVGVHYMNFESTVTDANAVEVDQRCVLLRAVRPPNKPVIFIPGQPVSRWFEREAERYMKDPTVDPNEKLVTWQKGKKIINGATNRIAEERLIAAWKAGLVDWPGVER